MSVDAPRIEALLVEARLRDQGDEVDLVCRYGSRVKGTTHRYPDEDLSWVPADEDTWHAITVMVGDTLARAAFTAAAWHRSTP